MSLKIALISFWHICIKKSLYLLNNSMIMPEKHSQALLNQVRCLEKVERRFEIWFSIAFLWLILKSSISSQNVFRYILLDLNNESALVMFGKQARTWTNTDFRSLTHFVIWEKWLNLDSKFTAICSGCPVREKLGKFQTRHKSGKSQGILGPGKIKFWERSGKSLGTSYEAKNQ